MKTDLFLLLTPLILIDDCTALNQESCSVQRDLCLQRINPRQTCDEAVIEAIDCSYSACRDDEDFCANFSSTIASIFEDNWKKCEVSIVQCEDLMAGDDVSPNFSDEKTCVSTLAEALETTASLSCDEIPLAFAERVEGNCDADDAKQCSGFVSSLNDLLNFNQCGEEALVEDCSLIQNDDNNVTTPDCASTMDFCADYSFLFEDFPKECSEFENAMFRCFGKACEKQSGVCSAFPDVIASFDILGDLGCSITDEKCLEKFEKPPANDCDVAIAACTEEFKDAPCTDVLPAVRQCASDFCNTENDDDHCTSLRLHLNALVGNKGCFNTHITQEECTDQCDVAIAACIEENRDSECKDIASPVAECAAVACEKNNKFHCNSLHTHVNTLLRDNFCYNFEIGRDDCVKLFEGTYDDDSAIRASSWVSFAIILGSVIAFFGN